MNFKAIALATAMAVASGCAHYDSTVLVDKKIEGPKEIALSARTSPWLIDIESRLRKKGFKVFRMPSQRTVREQVSPSRSEEYKESSARYVLVIDGQADVDAMHRCFGGGYKFSFLTAELVDTKTNETVLSASGTGYSEGCPPAASNLYGNIIDTVAGAWAQ